MCGIAGCIQQEKSELVRTFIHDAILNKLRHRGYDSYGFWTPEGVQKRLHGEFLNINELPDDVHIALGHTRWSTHGKPTLKNAHPIQVGNFHVVHNGIIDNYQEIKERLGIEFNTDTDTEAIAQLFLAKQSLKEVVRLLKGQYAFCAVDNNEPNYILFAVKGSPLYITENGFIASEIDALVGYSEYAMRIPDNTFGMLWSQACEMQNIDTNAYISPNFNIKIVTNSVMISSTETKMFSEIKEQAVMDYDYAPTLKKEKRVMVWGCGSSYNAALLGRFYFEKIGRVPCCVEYASSIVDHVLFDQEETHYIALSQSGETKDTILAMEYVKGSHLSCITNNLNSTCAELSDEVIPLKCTKELAVAATKTFTMQCIRLLQLAMFYGGVLFDISDFKVKVGEFIGKWAPKIEEIAKTFTVRNALVLARGEMYPIAREVALKIKECGYVFAESLQAAEVKHGPIALIDTDTITIFLIADDANLDKITANIHEIDSRGGDIILILTDSLESRFSNFKFPKIFVPQAAWYLQPILHNMAGQLLAYYVASNRGNCIDEPRHLAKCVTV